MPTPLIEDSIDIDASSEQVWSIVSNLRGMSEWSPQVRKVFVREPIGVGTTAVTINRPGWKAWPRGLGKVVMWWSIVWPTRSKVVQLDANERIAFRILDNNTVWSYQIEPWGAGVRLTERRVAENVTAISKFLVDKILGGNDDFEQDVRRSIRQTLERIKAVAELGRPS